MFKSSRIIKYSNHHYIVNNIKSDNDYSTNAISIYTEKYINELRMNFSKLANKK